MSPSTLEQHVAEVLEDISVLERLDVTLSESRGCVLAEDVSAPTDWPHFNVCSLDGYAVRAADVVAGARFEVIDEVPTGFAATSAVGPGKSIRVHTGAPLPGAADTVLPLASVAVLDSTITVSEAAAAGSGTLAAASVAPKGKLLLGQGTLLDDRSVGILAAIGRSRVSVSPRPRVVVVSVGSELVATGAPDAEGLMHESTSLLLSAATDALDAIPYGVGPLPDDDTAIADTLDDQQVRADLLVVTGAVGSAAAGVPAAIGRQGSVTYDEGSTNLGRFAYGHVGEDKIPIVALPGDPVRAYLAYRILVAPMVNSMLGRPTPPPFQVPLAVDVREGPKDQILLASLDGSGRAIPVAAASPTLLDLQHADLQIRIPVGPGLRRTGVAVSALSLTH